MTAFIARHCNDRCIIEHKKVIAVLNSLYPFIGVTVIFNRITIRLQIRLAGVIPV